MYDNSIGYWNSKKVKIRQKYPVVTDGDLNFYEGNGNDRDAWVQTWKGSRRNAPDNWRIVKYFFVVWENVLVNGVNFIEF